MVILLHKTPVKQCAAATGLFVADNISRGGAPRVENGQQALDSLEASQDSASGLLLYYYL